MRRVAVTGLGIISSIGNNKEEVITSLREGRSGISYHQEYADLGFRTSVHGPVRLNLDELVDRKIRRFMGDGAAFNYLAMLQAIEDARLENDEVSSIRTGLIMGTGAASTESVLRSAELLRTKGARKVGPFMVPRTMSSTNAACLATTFHIKGMSYSISSACATSAHCIGHGAELIQMDKQDIVFAGGGEDIHWSMTLVFDAMGALSSKFNDRPQSASRPYDTDRDGFVISGGGGVLVLEELERAKARGAKIYAEVAGYGATSDGFDMVLPSGEGAVRCMQQASAAENGAVDYINAHGTSTPAGDIKELDSIKEVFGERVPLISSTKSLGGHALGAAGVHEAIYSLLMMESGFVCASANIEQLDPRADGVPIVRERVDGVPLRTVMSNSFGFGGTNACLLFRQLED
ncbi:MAG: beta-ketoacyl-ACP synthase I [Acidiferrobacterales bacterium]